MTKLLEEIRDEMYRAMNLHGDNYMGELKQVVYDYSWTLDTAIEAGESARKRMEESAAPPCKSDVFIEEVGELMDDLKNGYEARGELVQVAAMALAWLGVDPKELTGG